MRVIFSSIVLLLLCTGNLTAQNKTKLFLTNNWQMARVLDVKDSGTVVSVHKYLTGTDKWLNAVVPGTVLFSYFKNGKIADPYYGLNMFHLNTAYYDTDYWYRTNINIPLSYKKHQIWLNFDGINRVGGIFVNGKYVGTITGAFTREKFNITKIATPGNKNTIAVKLSMPDRGLTFAPSAGWDWIPAIPGRNIGIYEDVYLSTSDALTIADPFVISKLQLPDTSLAKLSVNFSVHNTSVKNINGIVNVLINPGNIKISKSINIKAGAIQTSTLDAATFPDLNITHPKLWWPNGFGRQNLYSLSLNVTCESGVSDEITENFGIRNFTYNMKGHELYLSVNGRKIMCKGGNWGMPDAMLHYSAKDYDNAIRLHRDMNFNMIRNWYGTADNKRFYDACDKYGIMVFEDFGADNSWVSNDAVMHTIGDKIKKLRNRACLAIWCGTNEQNPPEPLFSLIPALLAKLDTTRQYYPASDRGGIHGRGDYTLRDLKYYFADAHGFSTERGAPCVPSIESMRAMMPAKDLWPILDPNRASSPMFNRPALNPDDKATWIRDDWYYHDFNKVWGGKETAEFLTAIDQRYGPATDISDFCKKAQMVNIETYKAIFEGFNNKLWNDCSGVLLWMSQPAWPSTMWQTYDRYFDQTGAFWGAKKACEPIHIQWNVLDNSIKVVNHSANDLNQVTAHAMIYNLDGTLAEEHSITLNAKSNSINSCFILPAFGANIALHKPVTASSADANCPPLSLTDTAYATIWKDDGNGDMQWICVDLLKQTEINSVLLRWQYGGWQPAQYARAYQIQLSDDDKNWTTVYQTVNGQGVTENITFPKSKARYVRMMATARASEQPGKKLPYALCDFEVYQPSNTDKDGFKNPEPPIQFIKLELVNYYGKIISDNFYWRGNKHLVYTAMQDMPLLTLQSNWKKIIIRHGNQNVITTIKNTTGQVALAIRLRVVNKKTGERILPVFYDDNYFSLLPGESKIVSLTWDRKNDEKDGTNLLLDGWNIKPAIINERTQKIF